ncbi:glycosyltransferase family 39 protein [Bdellovibrio sp. ArHS]|uniref:glycosyltransferase family 39 protein n=1 Tax=Bdellovibrio sp. ArHS TaxID=1569284 RepID=UPI000B19FB7C|nr:glycosyltransferase family 39 protein [Bdellovibrio sp. ArHS]
MIKRTLFFLSSASLIGMVAGLAWIFYLSPRPYDISFIQPDMKIFNKAPATMNHRGTSEGLYWLSFKTPARTFALNKLILRTRNCIHSLSTDNKEWSEISKSCDNKKGLSLENTGQELAKDTQWHFAGSTRGDLHGVILDKDWSEPKLAAGLLFFLLSLALFIFAVIPADDSVERGFVTFILIGAFLLRFWFVFIISPPELSLFSDMGAYFQRAWEISRHSFNVNQLFQPVGFTLWSQQIRDLGGFELFNWTQVFLSWGIVLFIYLMARERFGRLAGAVAVLFAAIHIPQAAMASMHLAENIYGFFLTMSLWVILRTLKTEKLSGYFLTGILLMLSFYFKGNHAFFIPIFSLWLLYQHRQNFFKGSLKVLVLGLGCMLVAAPHLAWTQMNYGKAFLGPTAGALNFVEGKCPSKDNQDSQGNRWMSPLFHVTGEKTFKQWPRPFTDQNYFWKEGFKCVAAEPMVLGTSLRYIYYLFGGNMLWPIGETPMRSLFLEWEKFFLFALLPFTLVGALVYARRKDDFSEVAALLMLSLFLTVWFFKSENRLRVPFDAVLIIWSAVGYAWALEKLKVLARLMRGEASGDLWDAIFRF